MLHICMRRLTRSLVQEAAPPLGKTNYDPGQKISRAKDRTSLSVFDLCVCRRVNCLRTSRCFYQALAIDVVREVDCVTV
jgi:hypothetical protein